MANEVKIVMEGPRNDVDAATREVLMSHSERFSIESVVDAPGNPPEPVLTAGQRRVVLTWSRQRG